MGQLGRYNTVNCSFGLNNGIVADVQTDVMPVFIRCPVQENRRAGLDGLTVCAFSPGKLSLTGTVFDPNRIGTVVNGCAQLLVRPRK